MEGASLIVSGSASRAREPRHGVALGHEFWAIWASKCGSRDVTDVATACPVATAMSASSPQPVVRFCASCLAIYRQDFQRCPLDGATLVVGANDPWLGLTVGARYVIEALIGEGAMGRVYRAHHRHFRDRRYAIKIIVGDLAGSAQMRARFELEAEHAKKLSHPNVVGVVDFGVTEHGIHFMAMELVEGPTLGAILRQGPMAPERVIMLARQICEGLHHAHDRGMIHRDLKPDNILVLSEREHEIARIADFGLALSKHDEARLTTTGVVCTPAYASPEQLRGEAIDHRVDLYALGTTMFEMLSGGILPFNGDVDATVTNKLRTEAPSIVLAAPNVPPALVAIIGRLLSPQPERRPRSARAVIRALDQAMSAPRVPLTSDQTQRLRVPVPIDAATIAAKDADAYTVLQIELPTRRSRLRRTTVQLLACGLTLSGVLAWADLHEAKYVRAEPTLVAVAEPASTSAAASIQTSTTLDVDALRSVADDVSAPVDMDVHVSVSPALASYMVPSFALRFGQPVSVPAQLMLVPERSVMEQGARLVLEAAPAVESAPVAEVVKPAPVVKQTKRARVVRQPAGRRVIRAAAPPTEPEVDVVEQMLDAAAAEPAADEPAETETVEVPGVLPTPAVAAPSAVNEPSDEGELLRP